MKRHTMIILSVAALLSACSGSSGPNGNPDLATGGLPDGFTNAKCVDNHDCDDGDLCTSDVCNFDGTCSHTTKSCGAIDDECNLGRCDSDTGGCVPQPRNEGDRCQEMTTNAGMCVAGACVKDPTCAISSLTALSCGTNGVTPTTRSGVTGGTSLIADYGTCGSGYMGGELVYKFLDNNERAVKVTLTSVADLDLIVLEGTRCVGNAPCVVSSATAPAGGTESVTFTAKARTQYLFVVESKTATSEAFTPTSSAWAANRSPLRSPATRRSAAIRRAPARRTRSAPTVATSTPPTPAPAT